MANIKSAIKRIDVTKKQTLRNKTIKTGIKTSIRKFEDALENGNVDEARELLRTVDKKMKKAASKNIIHKNAAARKMSRLSKKLGMAN
ncbi:30S ribosomal protein S20 [Aedoeadaptatus ivorii]|uniref:Small ribosomal subunit protein bS20 n=1 Tax=Aedoeadaptatus ivorii TaxID=54006 RepID=A0A3S4YV21_9FIRM|nr:30S ribosomal protein S20 [Peptoniphilus ivorii]MDQ0507586.1 small subunit ribosomal protein S20 [Peptoniphilus ivorii]VEJ35209.1 30S ribosomal protein S20 [Peptoniphilus ivorii]